jgi:hypothetical protein
MSRSTDPHADLKMEVDSADGFLLATISGAVSLSRSLELLKAICDAGVARGFQKILVDCLAVTGELSLRERYALGKEVSEYMRTNQMSLKIAFLGEEPVTNGVAVGIAQNRGLDVESFSERQRALTWLHDPNSRPPPHRNTG